MERRLNMNLKKIITLLVLLPLSVLPSCGKKETPKTDVATTSVKIVDGKVVSDIKLAKVGDFIFDGEGRKYKKITDEKTVSDNITQTDIWERVEPLDKKHWYTPTLGSELFAGSPPLFSSLFRLDDEEYPIFN